MENKYELLKNDYKEIDGQRVYRIRAPSKIQDKAQVLGKATVEQSVVVAGARVSGEAVVRNYKVDGVAFSGKTDKGISDAGRRNR